MKPTNPHRKPRSLIPLLAILTIVALVPLAAATSWGPLGDVGANWAGYALVVAIVVSLVIAVMPHTRGKGHWGPIPKILIVWGVVLLALLGFNSGSAFQGAAKTATLASASPQPTVAGAAWSTDLYLPTSNLLMTAVNAVDHTNVNPTAKVYQTGATSEKAAFEDTSTPIKAGITFTSGAGTYSNYPARTYGCLVDVAYAADHYYEKLQRNQMACADKLDNPNKISDVPLDQVALEHIGTLDGNNGGTSVTCAAAATCDYTIKIENTLADSVINFPAVKITSTTNFTVLGVKSTSVGVCSLDEDSAATPFIGMLGSAQHIAGQTEVSCTIQVQRLTGSADASLTFQVNDLYKQFEATTFPTNTAINSADPVTVTVSAA